MKVAIIFDTSAGGLAGHGTHLAFRGLPVEMTAVADSNLQDLEARMKEMRVPRHYTDFVEMMDRERPDIAVLGSRVPGDHIKPFKAAAERGIHMLIEKPLCSTLEEADEMIRLAEKYRIKVAIAHLARHALVFRTMKKMVQEGAIGCLLTMYGRGKEDERGGGEDLAVLGTHILDLMNFLSGTPESLFSEVFCGRHPLKQTDSFPTSEPVGPVAGDNLFAVFRYPDNVRGIFESRRGIFQPGGQVRMGITLAGTAGCLSVRYDNGERTLRLTHSPYPPEDEASYEEVPLHETRKIPGAEPLITDGWLPYFAVNNRFAAWDLIEAVRENRQPLASIYDARTVLEQIQGIYASQLEGRRITLPLRQRRHPLTDRKSENDYN